jgi:threonine dehydrogenase-like Zn-dependent dehydrogenase
MALGMGAHHAIDTDAEAAVEEVLRLTGGVGAEVVIDTVGGETTTTHGLDMLRPGGRFSAFAVSHAMVKDVSTFPFYFKEVSIIGSRALLSSDMQPSIDLVASGKIDVSGFVTATYPLGSTADAFRDYEENPGKILRIVIDAQT